MHTAESIRPGARVGRLILLAAGLAGCNEWQVQPVSPQQTVAERHPSRVRITRTDRTDIIVGHPEIVGDSLYGTGKTQPADSVPRRQGFALSDIDHMAVRRTDVAATGLLIGGVAAVVTGLGVIIAYSIVANID